jgi:hypothetical protein
MGILDKLNDECETAWRVFNKHVEDCPRCSRAGGEWQDPPGLCRTGKMLMTNIEAKEIEFEASAKFEAKVDAVNRCLHPGSNGAMCSTCTDCPVVKGGKRG